MASHFKFQKTTSLTEHPTVVRQMGFMCTAYTWFNVSGTLSLSLSLRHKHTRTPPTYNQTMCRWWARCERACQMDLTFAERGQSDGNMCIGQIIAGCDCINDRCVFVLWSTIRFWPIYIFNSARFKDISCTRRFRSWAIFEIVPHSCH